MLVIHRVQYAGRLGRGRLGKIKRGQASVLRRRGIGYIKAKNYRHIVSAARTKNITGKQNHHQYQSSRSRFIPASENINPRLEYVLLVKSSLVPKYLS